MPPPLPPLLPPHVTMQAEAVLGLALRRLTALERTGLEQERGELAARWVGGGVRVYV